MPTLETGTWLKQYVDPMLLSEFKNYKDDFIGTLTKAPKGAIDTDGIKFNKLINAIGLHVNKTTAFTPVAIDAQKGLVPWDKLDTDVTVVTDAELRAMPFDKDSEIKKMHMDSWKIGIRNYVMYKLAPTQNTATTPVVRTTGATVGTRKRLTIGDLINYITELKKLNLTDTNAWYMILCPEHEADLLLDRNDPTNVNRGDLIINPSTGKIDRLYELKFFTNNFNVTYTTAGVLRAQGAAAVSTDRNASIFYYAPNTVYHVENVMSLYTPMQQATRTIDPQSDYRLHSYGLCDKKQDYGFGAIISAVV
jgi:hypothetical protein